MKKQYSAEFKIEVVKRLEKIGDLNKVAKELEVAPTTMNGWIKNIKNHLKLLFQGVDILSQNMRDWKNQKKKLENLKKKIK